MPRRNRRIAPPQDAATSTTVFGTPISELTSDALWAWLHHFSAPSRTRTALLTEQSNRESAL